MSFSVIESVIRRDRAIVLGALLVLTALAWGYVLWLSAAMAPTMPEMPGMTVALATHPWSMSDFLVAWAMWSVMMVGMMTPSAAPMILLYARIARQAEAEGQPFAPTSWFTGGYLLAWCGFAFFAALGQSLLLRSSLLTPMLASKSGAFGGLVLIAAGIYQWTPLKDACLAQCQSPLLFIQRQGGFKRWGPASLILGLGHGLYCIGCCWALMTVLFVVGVMNLLFIAALSIWVLLE